MQCVREFFKRRFDFESEEFPTFADICREDNLDQEVSASGFSKEMDSELLREISILPTDTDSAEDEDEGEEEKEKEEKSSSSEEEEEETEVGIDNGKFASLCDPDVASRVQDYLCSATAPVDGKNARRWMIFMPLDLPLRLSINILSDWLIDWLVDI